MSQSCSPSVMAGHVGWQKPKRKNGQRTAGRISYSSQLLVGVQKVMAETPTTEATCEWEPIDTDYGTWETSCEQAFTMFDGSPRQNDMRFCCYCGLPLKEVAHD